MHFTNFSYYWEKNWQKNPECMYVFVCVCVKKKKDFMCTSASFQQTLPYSSVYYEAALLAWFFWHFQCSCHLLFYRFAFNFYFQEKQMSTERRTFHFLKITIIWILFNPFLQVFCVWINEFHTIFFRLNLGFALKNRDSMQSSKWKERKRTTSK